MANLDNTKAIQQLDRENMLGNIQDFPDQVEKCWADWQKISIPTHYINAKSILILGMGGSAQGGGIVANLAEKESKIPIVSLRDYDIPGWVDKNTLIIAASYSGNTEETLTGFIQASKITDKLITIATGGKLESLGSQKKSIHYQIHYGSNPRAAMPYILTSILAIIKKLNVMEISDDDIKEAVLLLRALQKKIDIEIVERRNSAKVLATKLQGKIPVIIGGGTLTDVARRWKGQFNENSKNLAYFEILPEVNHNALLGLESPEALKKNVFFIILGSKYDHERNKIRQNLTASILQQKRYNVETVMIQPSGNPISETLQTILFGDYVSYYLAILNDVQPAGNGMIDEFKDKLNEKPLFTE